MRIVLEKTNQTVKLDASTVEIEERGVKLRLTVVDTPGYGDAIDNTDCFRVSNDVPLYLFNCSNCRLLEMKVCQPEVLAKLQCCQNFLQCFCWSPALNSRNEVKCFITILSSKYNCVYG